ncbi:hypothetical protein IV487_14600 [Enterococcus saccharolyticus]|uniref:hypothetical protein n=1 Tax=Enterococcus TaxID=1350 RepID=UPI001E481E13|nr:hypothetical protein [Enterococcus saccharolyticus]MCD5003692.1 hypothetical protein [Enterococcus saccharolyticus]
MSNSIGILIGLLLGFIILGITIIKNEGYYIARNPFWGLEKTEKEQKNGLRVAYKMIWFSSSFLFLIFLFIITNVVLKLLSLLALTILLIVVFKYYKMHVQ